MEMKSAADGGFFVFGDLSVKLEGEFRLLFSLFEMFKYDESPTVSVFPTDWTGRSEVVHIKSVMSEPFTGACLQTVSRF